MSMYRNITLLALLFTLTATTAFSQMERKRVDTGGPVEGVFWAPNLVGMSNTHHLEKQNLNVTIMHNFGLINNEPFKNFFGLDAGANVRLGLDYGISDRWSVGIGRTTFNKLYDFRTKYAILRQNKSGTMPVSVSGKFDLGIRTVENNLPVEDDLSYFGSIMISRKLSDKLSLQVAPMYAHFNTVSPGDENSHFVIGLGGEYHITDRLGVIAEYYPVVGDRSQGTVNAFALGVNIETGGHVFQLFLKTTNWHTEQHILSTNDEEFFAGDFRFGFNVNRIFWLGKK